MHRLHPQWDLALSLVASGRIGAVRRLESAFAYDMGDKPLENRLSRDRAGGALLDVGCYCLHFSRLMAGAASGADPGEGPVEPIGAEASSDFGPSGVDLATRATLLFPGGIEADFACALRGPARKLAVVHGEEGRIEIAEPWHPAADGAEIRVVPAGGDAEIWKAGDGLALFAREALAAAEASARGECPALTRRGSVGQARALEALRRSAGHI
jgi:predicted dehydrogenase